MSNQNIIIDIFKRSFNDYPEIISSSIPLINNELKRLKIDIQDTALINSMSAEDLDEIITRIKANNEILCSKINESASVNSKDHKELIDNFFDEINNTIDFVYNLIISKQLGG